MAGGRDIPGPRSLSVARRSARLIGPANRITLYNIVPVRGEGAEIVDADGNRYLDCLAGASANVLGYGRVDLVAAYADQAAMLQHNCFAYSPTEPALELAEQLIDSFGASRDLYRVLLGLSGSDVNGAAIEISRRATGRRGVLKFDLAYHGTTGLSQPASGFESLNEGVHPPSPEFVEVKFPSATTTEASSLDAVEQKLREQTFACVLVEVIQGDAGVRVPTKAFVRRLQTLAATHNTLLVVDEVQSGMGRTGELWCWKHFLDEPPDLVTIGKGLSAGYAPIAALIGKSKHVEKLSYGQQALTYAGHPPSCAVALRCLEVLQSAGGPVQNAARRGAQLLEGLSPLCTGRPIKDVRGKGLMIGVEIDLGEDRQRGKAFAFALAHHGIHAGLVGGAQEVIRLSPPLTITASQVDQIVAAFDAVAREFRDGTPPYYAGLAREHSIGLGGEVA